MYGLLLVTGAAAAWLVILLLAKRKGRISVDDAMLAYFIAIGGGFIGLYALRPIMRIVEVAANWERFMDVPAELFLRFIFGEAVFYGGLIGGLIAIFLYCRKFKMKMTPVLDIFAPGLALAHGIGRIGCFLAGCCHGAEVRADHPFAVVFPYDAIAAPGGVPLLAVQPIETAMLVLLSAVLVKSPGNTSCVARMTDCAMELSALLNISPSPGVSMYSYVFLSAVKSL